MREEKNEKKKDEVVVSCWAQKTQGPTIFSYSPILGLSQYTYIGKHFLFLGLVES